MKLQQIYFTFGGLVTFDCFQTDAEIEPTPMMAYYWVSAGGVVTIASLWVNSGTEKAPMWVTTRLPRFQQRIIENQIEDGLRTERDQNIRNVREVAEMRA